MAKRAILEGGWGRGDVVIQRGVGRNAEEDGWLPFALYMIRKTLMQVPAPAGRVSGADHLYPSKKCYIEVIASSCSAYFRKYLSLFKVAVETKCAILNSNLHTILISFMRLVCFAYVFSHQCKVCLSSFRWKALILTTSSCFFYFYKTI